MRLVVSSTSIQKLYFSYLWMFLGEVRAWRACAGRIDHMCKNLGAGDRKGGCKEGSKRGTLVGAVSDERLLVADRSLTDRWSRLPE
jgi:hypothetical protein